MTGADPKVEAVDDLRRQIARLERASPLGAKAGTERRGVRLGYPQIEARFEGGRLPFGVHEAAARSAAEAPQALGFGLMLMATVLRQDPRGVGLIIQTAMTAGESGVIYGPGLSALGLEPARVALVRVRNEVDAFRVIDDALRSGALTALVAELWSGEGVDLSLTRRFNLSAEAHGVLAVLAMREPAPQSAVLTRWQVGAAVSSAEIARAAGQGAQRGRRPRLGRPALQLSLTRNRRGAARGPRLGEWCVEWDGETCSFRASEALSAPVAGQVADRSDAAVA